MAILRFTPKTACEYLEKLLKSAMANAENNHQMDVSKLYVAECYACPRPDPQEDQSQGPRTCTPHFEENISRHPGAQGT